MVRVLEDSVRAFTGRGIRAVLIGSTVVDFYLGGKFKDGDLDFFSANISPLVEEDLFRGIAEELGWDFSYTDLGTPRLIARAGSLEVTIDIYENIADFYVPPELLEEEVVSKKLARAAVEHLTLEAYVVLKSRAGRESDETDLKTIGRLVSSGRLKVDVRKIERLITLFPEDERDVMAGRLRRASLI